MVQPMDKNAAPGPKLTPAEFAAWQAAEKAERQADAEAAAAQRQADVAAGNVPLDDMTGKELAEHHPEVFKGY